MKKPFSQRIEHVLYTIGRHTRYGAIYYSFENSTEMIVGHGVCRFCHLCAQHARTALFCRNSACSSAVQGHAIGDSWYFRCWLGIDSIAIPVAPQGDVIGTLEIGGFFSPGGTEQAQQNILTRLASIAVDDGFQIMTHSMQGIRELDFKQVKAISDFALEGTFAEGLNDAASFAVRHQIYSQQERLAAKVGKLQDLNDEVDEQMASLQRLQAQIKSGDRHGVLHELDNFLGQVLLEANGRLDAVRASVLILNSLLFQVQIKQGMSWESHIHEYEKQLVAIGNSSTIEDLCFWTESVVLEQHEIFRDRHRAHPAASSLSERLLAWMHKNYRRKITITEAALEIGASVSAITHSIKHQTGQTFGTHLNGMRVSEAKRLLAYSDLPLVEISNRCGFNDQSYFTKVFRKTVNLTPSAFRQMLEKSDLQLT